MTRDRRPMFVRQGLEARNQQAARDALRRRQKAKKAKQVKRHVHYKEKQKLLQELEANKPADPIVAPELSRPGDDDDSNSEQVKRSTRTQQNKADQTSQPERLESGDAEHASREIEKGEDGIEIGNPSASGEATGEPRAEGEKNESKGEKNERKKYLPFTKQMKEAERARKEREHKQKEWMHRIKVRERMLKTSKKERRERVS